jgi:hypothetical protein
MKPNDASLRARVTIMAALAALICIHLWSAPVARADSLSTMPGQRPLSGQLVKRDQPACHLKALNTPPATTQACAGTASVIVPPYLGAPNMQIVNLTGSASGDTCTITINPQNGQNILLLVEQNNTGATKEVLGWSAAAGYTLTWAAGTAGTVTTTAGSSTMFCFNAWSASQVLGQPCSGGGAFAVSP